MHTPLRTYQSSPLTGNGQQAADPLTWGEALENLEPRRERSLKKHEGAVRLERRYLRKDKDAAWTKSYGNTAGLFLQFFTGHERDLLLLASEAGLEHNSVAAEIHFVNAAHRQTPLASSDKLEIKTRHLGPDIANFWLRASPCRLPDGRLEDHILLRPRNYARLARGLLLALQELHTQNFVHLDFHPGNWVLPCTLEQRGMGRRRFTLGWDKIAGIDIGFGIHRNTTPRLCMPQPVWDSAGQPDPRYSKLLRGVLTEIQDEAREKLRATRPHASEADLDTCLQRDLYRPPFWQEHWPNGSSPLEKLRQLDWREDLYQLGYWLRALRDGGMGDLASVRLPTDKSGALAQLITSLPEALLACENASAGSAIPHAGFIEQIDRALKQSESDQHSDGQDCYLIRRQDIEPDSWYARLIRLKARAGKLALAAGFMAGLAWLGSSYGPALYYEASAAYYGRQLESSLARCQPLHGDTPTPSDAQVCAEHLAASLEHWREVGYDQRIAAGEQIRGLLASARIDPDWPQLCHELSTLAAPLETVDLDYDLDDFIEALKQCP